MSGFNYFVSLFLVIFAWFAQYGKNGDIFAKLIAWERKIARLGSRCSNNQPRDLLGAMPSLAPIDHICPCLFMISHRLHSQMKKSNDTW